MTLNDILGIDGECALCDPECHDCEKYTVFFNNLYQVTVGKKEFKKVDAGEDLFMIAVKTYLEADLFRKGADNFLKTDYKSQLGVIYGLVKELVTAPDIDVLCERILASTHGTTEFLKASLMAFLEVVDARGRAIYGAA